MLSVLLAHNFYGSSAPSGENQVYLAERDLLRRHGHKVAEFTRDSDTIRSRGARGALTGALSTPWNPFAAADLRRQVEARRPDIVHAHNTFPLISPAIFSAIGGRAARVLTLHNYRLFCPAAIPLRDGQPCTDCLDRRSAWPSLRHGCYRSSRLATLPLAISVELHQRIGTWRNHVDGFIALSSFQREKMVAAGLPAELVHVKPNFFPGNPEVTPWDRREAHVVFAGRLSREKGVHHLVKAWQSWGQGAPDLVLLGDGPLRAELERTASALPIRFVGQVSGTDAQAWIASARLLILPSVCFEGFPMVLREAFAVGTPAAVSAIGPMPDIVEDGASGIVFKPGDHQSLLQRVRDAWETDGILERMARGARAEFERKYNEGTNYDTLMEIYDAALHVSRRRLAAK